LKKIKTFLKDNNALAVVEATILFPVIIMIFIAFIHLAVYLPTSIAVHRSTVKAAAIVSAHCSDLGYIYDVENDIAGVNYEKLRSENVYVSMLFRRYNDETDVGLEILEKYIEEAFFAGTGTNLSVSIESNDKQKYVLIQAEQTVKMPFNFPILPINNELPVKETMRVMIRNTDEFIRSMDIIYDLTIKKSAKVTETLGDTSKIVDFIKRIIQFFKII